MERTPQTKTTEEYILINWTYFQRMYKAYNEIIIEDDTFKTTLAKVLGNQNTIFLQEQAFLLRKEKTRNLDSLFTEANLSQRELKEFFRNEMIRSLKQIRLLMDELNQLV